MFRPTIRRVTTLFAVGATFGATLVAGSPASAATYFACVKKSGAAHIFTSKPKCHRHEKTLSWNTVGKTGANGKNGTNGAKGETGAPGGFFGVLPSGKMMQGAYAAQGAAIAGQQYRTGVSFLLSLSAPIKSPNIQYVKEAEATPPGCGGSVADPIALPGHLCIFEGTSSENTENRGEFNPVTFEGPNLSMPVFGFVVYAECKETGGICLDEGTWAVTAP